MTEQQIKSWLLEVVHPAKGSQNIVELGMVDSISSEGNKVVITLAFPKRLPIGNRKLDFASLGNLNFAAPDLDRFPALSLAAEAIHRGGNIPCAMNAANEVAVAAFLQDRIGFYDIPRIIEKVMAGAIFAATPDERAIFDTDAESSARARELVAAL